MSYDSPIHVQEEEYALIAPKLTFTLNNNYIKECGNKYGSNIKYVRVTTIKKQHKILM